MKYPCLVKKKYCKTEVYVELDQEGLNNDGDRLPPVIVETKCNYQNSAKSVLTVEKKLVQLSGVALFPGDIVPDLSVISGGTIMVDGVTRKLFQGRKARNPDGSVNYCELDVM